MTETKKPDIDPKKPFAKGLAPFVEAGIGDVLSGRVLLKAVMLEDYAEHITVVTKHAKEAIVHEVIAVAHDVPDEVKAHLQPGDFVLHISAAADTLDYQRNGPYVLVPHTHCIFRVPRAAVL